MQIEELQKMKIEAERSVTDAMNAAEENFRKAGLSAKFSVSYVDMTCAEDQARRLFHLAKIHIEL